MPRKPCAIACGFRSAFAECHILCDVLCYQVTTRPHLLFASCSCMLFVRTCDNATVCATDTKEIIDSSEDLVDTILVSKCMRYQRSMESCILMCLHSKTHLN